MSTVKYKNLFVSGCSFTFSGWPNHLAELTGIENILNFAMPGAGNYHIMSSTLYEIENIKPSPKDTLVVIMLSGFDRDDEILDRKFLDKDYLKSYSHEQYYFNRNVCTGISGGSDPTAEGNFEFAGGIRKVKSRESRAIENFIYVSAIYNFLKINGFDFIITNHIDRHLPARDHSFIIEEYLNKNLRNSFINLIDYDLENIYRYCLKNDLQDCDDYHPSEDGHFLWTKNHLVPYIDQKFNKKNPTNEFKCL